MKFLWSADLKLNTVHVRDVCAAVWHLCEKGTTGEIYNLSDKSQTGFFYNIKFEFNNMGNNENDNCNNCHWECCCWQY